MMSFEDENGLQIYKGKIDFEMLELRKYSPYKLSQQIDKTVNGLDTETLNGYARIIADDKGRVGLITNIDDVLKFLTLVHYRNNHNFFYNLHYDVNAIIKYLPKENIEELNEKLKTTYKKYQIFYIPRKVFRITCHRHVHKFYDIMQFFGGSLEYNAKHYLGLDKYIDPIDRKTLGTSREYWNKNFDAIVKYCINDCVLTKKLGDILYSTLKNNIGLKPNAFTSEAGLTKEFVRTFTEIPDLLKVPTGAIKYAFYSYAGGRFEVTKKGYVGKCSLYDINSAYPYYIQDLIDVTQGEWQWTRSLHENATYGFYLVRVITKYNKISPINITLPNNTLCYPMIDCHTYMTKLELMKYDKYIDYEIIDGWEFFANENAEKPFYGYINHVYGFKQKISCENFQANCSECNGCSDYVKKLDMPYEYKTYKILMNGLYGCFYEKHKNKGHDKIKVGKLFNPIYASMITAGTRVQLWDYAMKDINNFVGFATDSVLFQGEPDLPTSNKLGDWGLEKIGDTTVLRSGFYKIDDIIKARGVSKKAGLITPDGIKYNSLFDYIVDKPKWTKYPVILTRPLSFSEVLHKSKTFTIEDINIFTNIEYVIDINKDYKRLWDRELTAGIELLENYVDSEPLVMY